MKRKKYFGKRILSFLLTFVLLFCQSGMFAFAEGEDEYVDEDVILESSAEEDNYGYEEGEILGTTTEEDRIVVPYDKNLINAVGVQGTNQCMAYAYAYAITIMEGKVHKGTEYWDGSQATLPSGWKKHTDASLKTVYDNINLNRPSVIHVTGQFRTGHYASEGFGHWVTVIGYKKTANRDALKASDFYIIDPGRSSGVPTYAYLLDGCTDGNMRVTATTSTSGGGTYTITNTGVTNISRTGATINATVSPMAYVSEVGFYLGTSKTNMQKHVENSTGNVASIWYDLGTGKWTGALSAGTTYYYKIYIISGGKTYESSVATFVTAPNPVINPATDIKDGGRYLIESVLSGKVIEVSNGDDTDRKQLNVWEYTNDPWQSWIAVKTGDKYILKNAYTGKAMDVYRASSDEGAAITQYTVDGSASQLWTLDKRDDGSYGIVNNNSGLAVDLIGFNKDNGATLGQYIYYANSNQRWYFNELNSNADVIIDSGVENITRTGAKLNATLPIVRSCTDIGFYLGTSPDKMEQHNEKSSGRTKLIWYELGTGKWTAALSKGTTYYYQLYCVIDGITYKTPVNSFTTLGDKIAPNIKQAYVTNITQDGYTVVCEATDNVGIAKVCFPTWTDNNGQDDLVSDWPNNTKAMSSNGNTYYYDVKISAHNNERGKYTTHVYAFDADDNAVCVPLSVTVPTYVTSISLSKSTIAMKTGETVTLTASIAPSDATFKELEWASSDEEVATVDNSGKIIALKAGKTTITAYAQDPNGKSASCEVTVTASTTPTPPPTDKATITAANVTAAPGKKVEVPVSISKNPGIAGAAFTVKYDKAALTLDDLKAGTVFSSGTYSSKIDSGLVQWYYAGDGSIKTNGVLFTAVFTVNASAAKGNYTVNVGLLNDDNANFTDHNGAEVPVTFTAGKVTVSDKIKGDLTGDGSVAMGDVVKIARAVAGYITLTEEEIAVADVTGDGKVAMGDVVKIARYVAGYIDSLDTTDTAAASSASNIASYQQNTIMSDIPGGERTIDFAGEAEMVVSGNKTKAGESVEIPVVLKTNPGIASAALTVSYDAATLELTSITKGEVFSEGTFNGDKDKNLIQWYDVSGNKDTTATGTAFTLGFKVKESAAAGSYTVKVGYLDNDEANVTNINSENVKVNFTDGVIKVEGGSSEQPDAKTAVMEVGSGKAEAGKSIDIPVKITTNPGIASAALTVSYDAAALSLKAITKGEVFNNGTFTGDIDKNLIQWYDVSGNKDTTATGVMFTLTFDVKDSAAEGKYAVKLGYLNDEETNVTNINSENVKVSFTAGEIEVEKTGQEEPDNKTAVVEVGKGRTISGNSISIPVKMTSNPGIASAALTISYDTTSLSLNSITKGDVFNGGTFTADTEKNLVQWYDVTGNKDTTKTGVMFTLKFDVKDSASVGKYAIKVGYLNDNASNVTNINSENVAVTFKDGEVELVAGSVVPGMAKEDPMCVAPDVTEETTDLYLIKGQKFTMPETGWTSSNKKFVSVSKKGVVKAKKVTTTPIILTKGERTINVYVTLPVIDKKLEIKSTDETNEYKIKLDYDSEHLDVYWCSNAPDVAQVDDEGVVEGVAAGSATITAYINGKAFKCKVKVKETEPYAERTVHVTVGTSKTIKIKGLKNPVWESDDTSIVTVNKNKITAVAKGMACLTTTVGEKKYEVYVRVEDLTLDDDDFTSIGKNKYSITMNAGDTEWVYFSDIYQDVVFTSTKSEIAYISNNTENLVARKPGKTKITAKVNGKPITIMVTVK